MNWVTKNGRAIPVKKMTDEHLRNAFRFVDRAMRRADAEADAAASCRARGDAAQHAAEQAFHQACRKVALCKAWLNILALEIAERSLDASDPEWRRL